MMNYQEDVLTDRAVIDRLSTSSLRVSKLCDQLTKLAVVQDEEHPVGLLSRIKSTLFASQEASIRFPFVTSCTIVSSSGRSRDPVNYFCVRADGRCCLLSPILDSATPSATEIASYAIPPSSDGYCSTSLFLGSRQGSLVAVSLDGGRITLLSVTSSGISLAKNLHLPVVRPISHLCLKDREGLVELYVGVDKKDIFILPDVRKSDKFAFLYSDEICAKIKEYRISTLTQSSLESLWTSTHTKKPSMVSPIQSTVLLGSRYDPFRDPLDFYSNYVCEQIEELSLIRGYRVPPSVRVDCLRRIKTAIAHAMENSSSITSRFYPDLILAEVTQLTKNCPTAHIDSIEYDEQSQKVIVAYDSGQFKEVVPIASDVSKYVLTFLSLPVTFQVVTSKTLSQSAAWELFEGTKNWLHVFACCSVGEAGDASPDSSGPVAEYLNTCITQSAGSGKLLIDKIRALIKSELTRDVISSSASLQVSSLEYVLKNLFVLEKRFAVAADKTLVRTYNHLRLARYLVDRLPASMSILGHRLDGMKIKCMEDFLNQLGLVFVSPRTFGADLGFIAASIDPSHDTIAKFHSARIYVSENKDKAWEIFSQIEVEMSLFVDHIRSENSSGLPIKGIPPSYYYYQYLLELFVGDYKHEILVLEKMVSLVKDEKILEQLGNTVMEKAIANGDWGRVKKLMGNLPPARRQDTVRLICTEARIRNELPNILDILKSDSSIVQLVVAEIDSELETNFTLSNAIQSYNLNLMIKNFVGAINAAIKIYEGLLCRYTRISGSYNDDTVFDIVDINMRLEWQLKALVLARSVYGKSGRLAKTLKYSATDLEKKLIIVDGLRALYSYTQNPIESIMDHSSGDQSAAAAGVVVIEIARNLAAVGLIKLSLKISKAYGLNLFKASILPFVELLLKCEKDSSFLPPCRFEKMDDTRSISSLLPPVTPNMAFVRSDSTGPIGCGGDQLRAMYQVLESVLRSKDMPNWVVLETVEFLYFNGARGSCRSAALVSIAEERGMWLDLLRMHMRRENFREAVRLVECHVKYWKPRVVGDSIQMRLDVPLLVQLQRAIEIVGEEDPDAEWLGNKLAQSLDELKSTLALLGERMMLVGGN